jgi:ABC-2 type transport system ATP-binding protein
MDHLLEAKGLRKSFGAIHAVQGVDLVVRPGSVVGFLGPNGAGKSTTMKLITGFLEPDAGTVQICGHDLAADPLGAKAKIGYLPEGAPAYPDMRVQEFLLFIAQIRGARGAAAKKQVEDVMALVHLDRVRSQSIETLSKGFKRRVGLAQALIHDPPVLILDEPTDGLDPNQKFEVRNLIQSMGKQKAIVLSTHILEEVEAVCTRAVVINQGKVVFDGTARELDALAAPNVSRNRLDHVFRSLTTADTALAGAAGGGR